MLRIATADNAVVEISVSRVWLAESGLRASDVALADKDGIDAGLGKFQDGLFGLVIIEPTFRTEEAFVEDNLAGHGIDMDKIGYKGIEMEG